MGMDARARGSFVLESREESKELYDEISETLGALIEGMVTRSSNTISLELDVGFSNQGYLDFFEWLEDLAETAIKGHVDLWYEELGERGFVRYHAGGACEEMDQVY